MKVFVSRKGIFCIVISCCSYIRLLLIPVQSDSNILRMLNRARGAALTFYARIQATPEYIQGIYSIVRARERERERCFHRLALCSTRKLLFRMYYCCVRGISLMPQHVCGVVGYCRSDATPRSERHRTLCARLHLAGRVTKKKKVRQSHFRPERERQISYRCPVTLPFLFSIPRKT